MRPEWRLDRAIWREVLVSSLPLGLATWFGAVINRVDFLMLERLASVEELGRYAAAYKVVNLFEALPLAVMGTVYPVMARHGVGDLRRLRRVYGRSTVELGLVGLGLAVAMPLVAPPLVEQFFGRPFAGADRVLIVLVWATACLYGALAGGNLLISLGRERASLVLNAVAAGANVALNFWLIPRLGAVGAAFATVAAYAVLFVGTTAP